MSCIAAIAAVLPPAPLCGVATALAVLGAEALHARRCRHIARLAFGPVAAPRRWTRLTVPLRAVAAGLLAWSLVELNALDGSLRTAPGRRGEPRRDVLLLLDVSPSMELVDAGPGRDLSRAERAAAIAEDLMRHLPPERVRISLAAFYTDARPLVLRSQDRAVIRNFLDDMPLIYAFAHGKTDLLNALNETAAWTRDWPPRSASLVVLTDGDTVSDKGLMPLAPAFREALVVGVGDPVRGIFIDGHVSRQDRTSLGTVARRLGARYQDGNILDIAPDDWMRLGVASRGAVPAGWGRRGLVLATLAAAAAALASLTPVLSRWGSAWRPFPPGGAAPRKEGCR